MGNVAFADEELDDIFASEEAPEEDEDLDEEDDDDDEMEPEEMPTP